MYNKNIFNRKFLVRLQIRRLNYGILNQTNVLKHLLATDHQLHVL